MRRLAALGFQSQARPPLPCHFVPIRRAISERDVSISGETTAPLPPSAFPAPAPLVCCFNLRRDHRSLATPSAPRQSPSSIGFQSQARPPLPCHFAQESHKNPFCVFQSQARPPLPCHGTVTRLTGGTVPVSISGETTAPLPPLLSSNCKNTTCRFQSQARPPLPCHMEKTMARHENTLFQSQARPPLPC